jgi:hypothetical protein
MFATGLQVQSQSIKARLSVEYHQIIGEDGSLFINAKFKGDDGYEPATQLKLNIYQEIIEDSTVMIGSVVTDEEGNANYLLPKYDIVKDSIITHKYIVKIEGDAKFKNAKKAVKFMDANLVAEIVFEDSLVQVSAMLTDAMDKPVKGKKLEVRVQRLFAPLTIGESSYKTDKKGQILVPMGDSLPSIDGNLIIEVVLNHKKYGDVKYIFSAPIAKLSVDESTYNERTMWSPPSKTPLFLWIFPNIVIFGIWFVIVLLISNLFKIYKS